MEARRWAVTANYRDPANYGVPELPDWTVRSEDGALAYAVDGEAFVRTAGRVCARR